MERLILLLLSAYFVVATLGGSGWTGICAVACAYLAGMKAPRESDDE